jgi:transcriptional regulator with XRE-family HTH domain
MPQLLGAKLRYLRELQGLNQLELAIRLGLARHTHITHIEAGRRAPSLKLMLRIAEAFGVATDYLLCDTLPVDTPLSIMPSHSQEAPPQLFGTKLHNLRLEHYMTQAALANALDLASQGYISKLEAGNKEPALNLIVKVADVFGVSTDFLLEGDRVVMVGQVKSQVPHQKTIADGEETVPSKL